MISTYSIDLPIKLITDYISFNVVAILVNDSELGLTDTPSPLEVIRRTNLDMFRVISKEISTNGGYARSICNVDTPIADASQNQASTTIRASFTPTGLYDPCTHIVYVTNASLVGADPQANGNNRGNVEGIVIKVAPLEQAPLQFDNPVTYNFNTNVILSF